MRGKGLPGLSSKKGSDECHAGRQVGRLFRVVVQFSEVQLCLLETEVNVYMDKLKSQIALLLLDSEDEPFFWIQ